MLSFGQWLVHPRERKIRIRSHGNRNGPKALRFGAWHTESDSSAFAGSYLSAMFSKEMDGHVPSELNLNLELSNNRPAHFCLRHLRASRALALLTFTRDTCEDSST
jgi:hypothetical protein